MRSKIAAPFAESRFPVGSSASTATGSWTRARAIATRWRSPPESRSGRWARRRSRPTAASIARARSRRSRGRHVVDPQRVLDVLERREHRHEVERLEDEAEPAAAQQRPLALGEGREIAALDRDRPGIRSVERAQQVQQGRLAAPGGSGDGHELAGARSRGRRRRAPRPRSRRARSAWPRRGRRRALSVTADPMPCGEPVSAVVASGRARRVDAGGSALVDQPPREFHRYDRGDDQESGDPDRSPRGDQPQSAVRGAAARRPRSGPCASFRLGRHSQAPAGQGLGQHPADRLVGHRQDDDHEQHPAALRHRAGLRALPRRDDPQRQPPGRQRSHRVPPRPDVQRDRAACPGDPRRAPERSRRSRRRWSARRSASTRSTRCRP